jgi:hypothetical protein
MWIKVSEYAKKHGVTQTTVRNKILRNTLASKKDEHGITLIEDVEENVGAQETSPEPSDGRGYSQQALETRWNTENELKRQKILNIQADIIIKKQKVVAYRERLRTEFCEGVLECYTDAFSDLKGVVVDLKLKKEHIKRFKDCYTKCLKKFEQKLRNYLKKKDDEEEEESNQQV